MKKILAISMIALFVFSNMGFTIATHFCHGHAVKSQLVFGEVNIDCGMTKLKKSCHSTKPSSSINKKKCCENDYLSLGSEKNLEFNKIKVELDNNFILALHIIYYQLIENDEEILISFKNYDPPPLIQEVHILNETFII